MDDELDIPSVCVCDPAGGDCITEWARVGIQYIAATDKVVSFLTNTFDSKRQMQIAEKEIKFYLRRALPETDQELIKLTLDFAGKNNQSPVQKGMMNKRKNIIQKINLLYKKLLNEVFPPMISEDILPTEKKSPGSNKKSAEKKSANENIEDDDDAMEGEDLDKKFERADRLARRNGDLSPAQAQSVAELVEVIQEIKQVVDKPGRAKKNRGAKSKEQDLFVEPLSMLTLLEKGSNIIGLIKENNWTVLEPCHGTGTITTFLQDNNVTVVAHDKYTLNEELDFLDYEIPEEIGIVVTNPPFSLKYEFVEKLAKWGKPFAVLLPIEALYTKCGFSIFQSFPYDLIIINGQCNFQHNGKSRHVDGCAWFLGNFPNASNKFTVIELTEVSSDDVVSEE